MAIIGYHEVGKTTCLNAILGNNYSSISDTKPTIGINTFRVLNQMYCSTKEQKDARKAETICMEIGRDNRSQRLLPIGTKKRVGKKVFAVSSTESSFAAMEDAPFYLVDIPGIDLSNSDCQYRRYVDEEFHTFDAVILVLDCRTEKKLQHRMLKYIRRHLSRTKKIPLIIVGNERAPHIGDSFQSVDLEVEIDEMFDIDSGDRVLQLDCIMSSYCMDMDSDGERGDDDQEIENGFFSKPIFVPVKLHDAFRYRLASTKLSLLQVSKLGATTLDKICIDEIGRPAWETLAKDERLDIVYSALSAPGDDYKLQETNFLKFMAHLERILRDVRSKHKLRAMCSFVEEENSPSFNLLSKFFCSRKDVDKRNGSPTIQELRNVNLGLADTLSEGSSRDSMLNKSQIEVSMTTGSSKSVYSDDASGDVPIQERDQKVFRNKRTAWRVMVVFILSAIIFTVIFVLFGLVVASVEE